MYCKSAHWLVKYICQCSLAAITSRMGASVVCHKAGQAAWATQHIGMHTRTTSVQSLDDLINAHWDIQILALPKTDCAAVSALFLTMPHLGPSR